MDSEKKGAASRRVVYLREEGTLRFEVQVETPQAVLGPDGTATGPRMEYFPDRQYALITGGAVWLDGRPLSPPGRWKRFFRKIGR